jgi:hypothetical protein
MLKTTLKYTGLAAISAVAIAGMGNSLLAQRQGPRSAVGFETLYQFTAADGSGGFAGVLVSDRNGGFFGVTEGGGTGPCPDPYGCGTVYRLSPPSSPGATWTKTTLYSFTGSPDDGQQPYGPLVFASSGALYGITQLGGSYSDGTIYSLTPPAETGAAWTETVLYSFTGGSDGCFPEDLIAGPDGLLFGVTPHGAGSGCVDKAGCGAAFSLTPPAAAGGAWTFDVLYAFTGAFYAYGPTSLITGPNRVLYGTTPAGSDPCYDEQCGTVFSLTPPAAPGGAWTQSVLHDFTGAPDGYSPNASLVLGPNGQIYGTTYGGGSRPPAQKGGAGTAFELTPPASAGGEWTETILFSFPRRPAPSTPLTGVVIGKDGTLYGSTPYGGISGCETNFGCGAVFALTPPVSPGDAWTQTILHRFTGGSDGAEPWTVAIGKDGALYGTTSGFDSSLPGTFFVIRKP